MQQECQHVLSTRRAFVCFNGGLTWWNWSFPLCDWISSLPRWRGPRVLGGENGGGGFMFSQALALTCVQTGFYKWSSSLVLFVCVFPRSPRSSLSCPRSTQCRSSSGGTAAGGCPSRKSCCTFWLWPTEPLTGQCDKHDQC